MRTRDMALTIFIMAFVAFLLLYRASVADRVLLSCMENVECASEVLAP